MRVLLHRAGEEFEQELHVLVPDLPREFDAARVARDQPVDERLGAHAGAEQRSVVVEQEALGRAEHERPVVLCCDQLLVQVSELGDAAAHAHVLPVVQAPREERGDELVDEVGDRDAVERAVGHRAELGLTHGVPPPSARAPRARRRGSAWAR